MDEPLSLNILIKYLENVIEQEKLKIKIVDRIYYILIKIEAAYKLATGTSVSLSCNINYLEKDNLNIKKSLHIYRTGGWQGDKFLFSYDGKEYNLLEALPIDWLSHDFEEDLNNGALLLKNERAAAIESRKKDDLEAIICKLSEYELNLLKKHFTK